MNEVVGRGIREGGGLFNERHICFDQGKLPAHWKEVDGDQASLDRLVEGLRRNVSTPLVKHIKIQRVSSEWLTALSLSGNFQYLSIKHHFLLLPVIKHDHYVPKKADKKTRIWRFRVS